MRWTSKKRLRARVNELEAAVEDQEERTTNAERALREAGERFEVIRIHFGETMDLLERPLPEPFGDGPGPREARDVADALRHQVLDEEERPDNVLVIHPGDEHPQMVEIADADLVIDVRKVDPKIIKNRWGKGS